MGKTVALAGRPLEWAHAAFAEYYREARIDPPGRFARREFAAFPFTERTLMRRHASFSTTDALHAFLAREAPRHVYYSCGYYRFPDHPTMAQKEWLGADLIFDLDADHLRGAERLGYPEQLERVRDRARDLFDDFLVRDFGIPEDRMTIVFSGGRGYHIHVHDPAYWPLSSPERRELVDYIQGTGVAPDVGVDEVREGGPTDLGGSDDGDGGGGPGRPRTYHRLAPADAPGWRGRSGRAVRSLLERWDGLGAAGARDDMEAHGTPPGEARSLARSLVTEGRGRQIRTTGALDVFPRGPPKGLLAAVIDRARIEVQGETDAPVTTDIHRLIRLPGSLHGGTGFVVAPLDRAGLDRFDPWRNATVPSPRGARATVELVEPVDYPFPDGGVAGAPGDVRTVTPPVALFLVLRGEARLPDGPG
ncbi:MAG TPA: DNA primase small subunit PriS [Thermoplasmata archaeon]|nr:DNA primase small subunit PriS [Thermoplasmata archaeon]